MISYALNRSCEGFQKIVDGTCEYEIGRDLVIDCQPKRVES